jgi:hypothetical protein
MGGELFTALGALGAEICEHSPAAFGLWHIARNQSQHSWRPDQSPSDLNEKPPFGQLFVCIGSTINPMQGYQA